MFFQTCYIVFQKHIIYYTVNSTNIDRFEYYSLLQPLLINSSSCWFHLSCVIENQTRSKTPVFYFRTSQNLTDVLRITVFKVCRFYVFIPLSTALPILAVEVNTKRWFGMLRNFNYIVETLSLFFYCPSFRPEFRSVQMWTPDISKVRWVAVSDIQYIHLYSPQR